MKAGIDTTFLIEAEVIEHPRHEKAKAFKQRFLSSSNTFALAPQVLEEFIHIITDEKRFEKPLSIREALYRAHYWWNSLEVEQVFKNDHSISWFLTKMEQYKLGRKRILDTMLAATYVTAGVQTIITANADDFAVFKELEVLLP
jgi:predicted nucleic acid-binding protein